MATTSKTKRARMGQAHRATGRIYLATISDICPPAIWSEIVAKTVEDAKAGDRAARDWLASYLVGKPDSTATTLHQIAVEEVAGTDPIARDATWEALSDALGN